MSARFDPEKYIESLKAEFPRLRVIAKESDFFSKLIAQILMLVTFGAQRRYLSSYVTTIGQRIYVPSGWDQRDPRSRYVTLRHEAVHLRQFQRYGLIGASLYYLIPILPMGLALGRANMEWEAYAETIRATAEVYGKDAAANPALRAHIKRQFVSGAYGWMWPFPKAIDRRIDEVLATLA